MTDACMSVVDSKVIWHEKTRSSFSPTSQARVPDEIGGDFNGEHVNSTQRGATRENTLKHVGPTPTPHNFDDALTPDTLCLPI